MVPIQYYGKFANSHRNYYHSGHPVVPVEKLSPIRAVGAERCQVEVDVPVKGLLTRAARGGRVTETLGQFAVHIRPPTASTNVAA